MDNITMSIKMIKDAGQPVCHVHQALLLTGRQHTRLWNHNFGQFWVSSHLGILDNLDVMVIVDNHWMSWALQTISGCHGHCGQFPNEAFCSQVLA